MMKEIRTFLAIQLTANLRELLEQASHELAEQVPKRAVRWVKPGSIHLTLRFLGDTAVSKLPAISSGMDQIAERTLPFKVQIGELGCFPNPRRPRVIWIGLDTEGNELESLQKDLEKMIGQLGWQPEGRRFHPHLTLGRVNNSREVIASRLPWGKALESRSMTVGEFHLIESQLRPDGAVYTIRHTSTLRSFPSE